jgi:hypothetical protein
VKRMRNEFPDLPLAGGFGGAGLPRRWVGKSASPGPSGNRRALNSLDKIGFVFHYFFYRVFAGALWQACRNREGT